MYLKICIFEKLISEFAKYIKLEIFYSQLVEEGKAELQLHQLSPLLSS